MDTAALELFAELSIGLVGFAGVVSALGKSQLHIGVRMFRIRALLLYSATSLFASIFPIVSFSFGIENTSVLMAATILMILGFIGILFWFGRTARPLTDAGHLPVALARSLGALGVVVILLLCSGLLLFPSQLSSNYLVGLSWILMMGVFHFCMLVLSIQLNEEGT